MASNNSGDSIDTTSVSEIEILVANGDSADVCALYRNMVLDK